MELARNVGHDAKGGLRHRLWRERLDTARSLAELIETPEALAEHQAHFRFPLLDLRQLADEEIGREPILRTARGLLTYSTSVQWIDRLRAIIEGFALALV